MWRQGDVLIQAVDEVPPEATHKKELVLAEGELTGHAHRILDSASASLFQHGDNMFLAVIAAQTTIVHEEHGPVTLAQGVYRVWQQREYAPESMMKRSRWVRD